MPDIPTASGISPAELERLKAEFAPLTGLRIDWLALPENVLPGFEPSQIAVIVNTLLDAALPQLSLLEVQDPENKERLEKVGLSKARGLIGDREAYPDYLHRSGFRVELKGLFVDNPALKFKRTSTQREPSARIKENVTTEEVVADRDVLMVAAVQLQETAHVCYPVIAEIGLFPMIECIKARDSRLIGGGGRWHNAQPQIIKKTSQAKYRRGQPMSDDDYAKDTNFGKLNRIPYPPLAAMLLRYGVRVVSRPEQA